MPCISFATGGDATEYDMIGYVAKDARNQRDCHVFDCGHMAHDIIATVGQAFELRYKQARMCCRTPLCTCRTVPAQAGRAGRQRGTGRRQQRHVPLPGPAAGHLRQRLLRWAHDRAFIQL